MLLYNFQDCATKQGMVIRHMEMIHREVLIRQSHMIPQLVITFEYTNTTPSALKKSYHPLLFPPQLEKRY